MMRRYVAWALVVTFLSQASGTAMAAAAGPWSVHLPDWLAPVHALVATARLQSGPPHPLIHHTPLPPRPPADYASSKRRDHFGPARFGRERLIKAAQPIDLVKLRLEHSSGTRHELHRVTIARHVLSGSKSQGPLNNAATPPPAPVTGIWPWWTYEERTTPGVGQAMVNVTNLNFIFEENDVDVPEGGIDLALRRMYNSESGHDYNNDDGSGPSVFGNKWTNNLDAHIWLYGSNQVSVYTGDGARDDFSCPSFTELETCTPLTPGIHDMLAPAKGTFTGTGGVACQFQWTKKSGTSYMFYAPYAGCSQVSGSDQGYWGRPLAVDARNNNFSIQLTYTWAGNNQSTIENLTQIAVAHVNSSGTDNTMTLAFQPINGSGTPTELSSITRPDGEVLQYYYSSNGDLLELTKPGNNPLVKLGLPTSFSDGNPIATGNLPETYDVLTPGQLIEVCGPRAAISYINNKQTFTEGACVNFDFTNHQLNDWYTVGILNPTPDDNVINQPIQTGPSAPPTGWQTWPDVTFVDQIVETSCPGGYVSEMSDGYNHETEWCYGSNGLVTTTSRLVTVGTQDWLTTSQQWDANNNLINVTDARGYTTNMAYDANGNTLEVSLPEETVIINGKQKSVEPTSFYDYDAYNNVLHYCDPANNPNNSWNPSPAPSPCANSGSTNYAVFTFNNNDTHEPYGCLTQTQKPGGYQTLISYSNANCGSGLPLTAIASSAISQPGNPSSRTPEQVFTYDNAGDLKTYNDYPSDPNGKNAANWTLTYDSNNMHRLITRTDPDNVTSYWCYNLDGSAFYTETANQHNLDGDPTGCPGIDSLKHGNATIPNYADGYRYDADGDVMMQVSNHGCDPRSGSGYYCDSITTAPTAEQCTSFTSNHVGTTCKYYDGLDRLVEVKEPWDNAHSNNAREVYTNPWITRYLYDLLGGSNQYQFSASGGTQTSQFYAYGNLFETQELLPKGGWGTVASSTPFANLVSNGTLMAIKATAYDGLDRVVQKFSNVSQGATDGNDSLNTETLTWDTSPLGNGNVAGLLGKDCNDASPKQCQQFFYQPDGKESQLSSSDGSAPGLTYLYDPDDRPASITSTIFNNPQTYTYDVDGNLTTAQDPSGYNPPQGQQGTFTSPALLTYVNYPDGKVEKLEVTSNLLEQDGQNGTKALRTYSYRQDGVVQTDVINDNSVSGDPYAGANTISDSNSDAGRIKQRQETFNNSQQTTNAINYSYSINSANSTGLPTKQTLDSGQVTVGTSSAPYVYSAENELLAVGASAGLSGCQGASNTYSIRGELVQWNDCSQQITGGAFMANGITFQSPSGANYVAWDGNQSVPIAAESCSSPPSCNTNWSYDSAGRMTQESIAQGGVGWTIQRCYDAQNRTTGTLVNTPTGNSCPGSSSNPTTIAWGPNGHPALITNTDPLNGTFYESLHWDGDQLLFATSSRGSNVLDDIKIDDEGDITPADTTGYRSLTFYDRGPGGQATGCHNATGYTFEGIADGWSRGFKAGTVWLTPCSGASGSTKMPDTINWYGNALNGYLSSGPTVIGEGGVLGMPRPDGLTDGLDTIQGVRIYDSNAGNWTTPDAYAGEVHDPKTQKDYIWNDNNPLSYSDPSGYNPQDPDVYGPASGGRQGKCWDCLPPADVISWQSAAAALYDQTHPGVPSANQTAYPYAMHDFGSRPGDAIALAWAIANYNEANGLTTPPGYEIGAILDSTNFMKPEQTIGGGNVGAVDWGNIGFNVGDALVHSHGENTSPEQFSQHVDLLGPKLFSAVYTLSGGYLWVQWYSGGVTHTDAEQIYNVCASVRGAGCGH